MHEEVFIIDSKMASLAPLANRYKKVNLGRCSALYKDFGVEKAILKCFGGSKKFWPEGFDGILLRFFCPSNV